MNPHPPLLINNVHQQTARGRGESSCRRQKGASLSSGSTGPAAASTNPRYPKRLSQSKDFAVTVQRPFRPAGLDLHRPAGQRFNFEDCCGSAPANNSLYAPQIRFRRLPRHKLITDQQGQPNQTKDEIPAFHTPLALTALPRDGAPLSSASRQGNRSALRSGRQPLPRRDLVSAHLIVASSTLSSFPSCRSAMRTNCPGQRTGATDLRNHEAMKSPGSLQRDSYASFVCN